jgi:tRNA-2-methylthio-N6-dimethylallyladenosine synthase
MHDQHPTPDSGAPRRPHAEPLDEARQGEALRPADGPSAEGPRAYIESYGCQMNFSDSEIVASILTDAGYGLTRNVEEADLILLNTCSIRDKAEQRIRHRLAELQPHKKARPETRVGILGCMAERLKAQLLEEEQLVDLVCGPDAYRDLPNLVAGAETGQKAVNVLLSREETYEEITPVRLDTGGVTAFISIMRGCDNMCSFCVVPFTRGRERSRNAFSIEAEARDLFARGYREVTLLGQNVDSYRWTNPETGLEERFDALLERVARVDPDLRVRFSTSHPKDMTDAVLHAMARHPNVCNYIHLPVQSGSSTVLERMNRTYDRAWYLDRVAAIRRILPQAAISTDVIAGFCGETEAEHAETLSLMEAVRYEMAYMFHYSERPRTLAARRYADDVPEAVKKRRLEEIIALQTGHSLERNRAEIGRVRRVLVEKTAKRSAEQLCGRTDQNKMVVFAREGYRPGQYVDVLIEDCSSATLRGRVVGVAEHLAAPQPVMA